MFQEMSRFLQDTSEALICADWLNMNTESKLDYLPMGKLYQKKLIGRNYRNSQVYPLLQYEPIHDLE